MSSSVRVSAMLREAQGLLSKYFNETKMATMVETATKRDVCSNQALTTFVEKPDANAKRLSAMIVKEQYRDQILTFWFGDDYPEKLDEQMQPKWFKSDADFDARIKQNFGDVIEFAMTDHLDSWATDSDPHTRLALTLCLDQFTRNVFRGESKSYQADTLALKVAKATSDTQLAELPFTAQEFMIVIGAQ